jgi:hypothetical protein
VVVVDVVVFVTVAVAGVTTVGHGHDHVYGHDLLRLSRDYRLLLAGVDQPELGATVGGSP